MQETNEKPSLRISHIVYGRTAENGRVKYLVDPKGGGDERAIPEEVVLRRWRRRHWSGYVFSGERLSSTVWRALPALLGPDTSKWPSYDVRELRRLLEGERTVLREQFLVAPAAETIHALVRYCGQRNLKALVTRHGQPDRKGHSGVPDLFLFARDLAGQQSIARFVEVKKPEEPVSQDQHDEIAFIKNLGLHARVLRLIERSSR